MVQPCMYRECIEKRIINTNTAQWLLGLKQHTRCLAYRLPPGHGTKMISELCPQALHPTETSPTRIPVRRAMGPIRVPFRQANKRTRAVMECQNTIYQVKHVCTAPQHLLMMTIKTPWRQTSVHGIHKVPSPVPERGHAAKQKVSNIRPWLKS